MGAGDKQEILYHTRCTGKGLPTNNSGEGNLAGELIVAESRGLLIVPISGAAPTERFGAYNVKVRWVVDNIFRT